MDSNKNKRIRAALFSFASILIAACGGGGGGGPPPSYTVGGSVSGLAAGTSVVLQNDGSSVAVASNSAFTFSTGIGSGVAYQVTVATQPTGQNCSVAGGAGTVTNANVTNVSVTCVAVTHTIGGAVSGLADGASIVLQDNGGDSMTVSSNGAFTFATAVAVGSEYTVSIGTQPPYQGCAVSAGSGTVANSNVTNVVVHCPLVQVIWNFGLGADGDYLRSAPILGSDGNFYGTTEFGGLNDYGAVYSFSAATGESVVASFSSGTAPQQPIGPLFQASDGNFYGTTYSGGTNNAGSVYKLTTDGTITTLWNFGSGADGQFPYGGLVQARDGNFYGTTASGGTTGHGTAFRLTPAGIETVVWNFGTGVDGLAPEGSFVIGSDGNLYGTTSFGGTNGSGTIVKITLTGVEAVVWNFSSTIDGYQPAPNLITGSDGNLYGTTEGGGPNGGGTLFRFTPQGTLSVVWAFGAGADGNGPWSGVVQGSDGNFYGTTVGGGTIKTCGGQYELGCGTIFRITPAGEETVLWDFGFGGNGASTTPLALVQGVDGSFFGVTSIGGVPPGGTIYQLQP